MKACVESGKRIPSFYVSRLAKLETKKKILEKRTQVHMTVTIRFFIDDDTLRCSQALSFLQAGTDPAECDESHP